MARGSYPGGVLMEYTGANEAELLIWVGQVSAPGSPAVRIRDGLLWVGEEGDESVLAVGDWLWVLENGDFAILTPVRDA